MSAKVNVAVTIAKAVREVLNDAWLDIDPQPDDGVVPLYSASEVRALVKAIELPGGWSYVDLNEHARYSLQQFLWECGSAYARHLVRMEQDRHEFIAIHCEATAA